MPRPTPAQICYGTLAVVVATIALLAASGTSGVVGVTVLVVAGLALGTLATALAMTAPARRRAARQGGRIVASGSGGTGPDVDGSGDTPESAESGTAHRAHSATESRLASWASRR
jgi:hypothetical protein